MRKTTHRHAVEPYWHHPSADCYADREEVRLATAPSTARPIVGKGSALDIVAGCLLLSVAPCKGRAQLVVILVMVP